MENVVKREFERAEKVMLSCVVMIAVIFGMMNPAVYISDCKTAEEVSRMGGNLYFDTATFTSGYMKSKSLSDNLDLLMLKPEAAGGSIVSDIPLKIQKVRENVKIIHPQKKAANPEYILSGEVTGRNGRKAGEAVRNVTLPDVIMPDAVITDITHPAATNSDLVANPDKTADETEENTNLPVSVEIRGMKVDADGFVTEIMDGVSDGLLVFPNDARLKGIRAEVIEQLDEETKQEITEIWIPANITSIETGAFDCLKNVNFIETAPDNPGYYSETGILYDRNGTLICMPQRRNR